MVTLDLDACEALLRGAPAGGSETRRRIALLLVPWWTEQLRAQSPDDANEIVTTLLGKLSGFGASELASYEAWRARHPTRTLEDWLRIVLANATRDQARRVRRAARLEAPSRKRWLNELARIEPDELGQRPPVTAAQTARELLEFARDHLTGEQLTILDGWLRGATLDELAENGNVGSADHARRKLRAALAMLRRRFSQGVDDEG